MTGTMDSRADGAAAPGLRSSEAPGTGPEPSATLEAPSQLIDEAGRQLRAPWAAAVAGLLFALFFTVGLILLRSQPIVGASDEELADIFASGGDLPGVIGGLYLAPFAGVMFLWFVAVIRDQVGDREDRFFATVFLGSGLIFVATLFAASAVASAPIVGPRYLGMGVPTQADVDSARVLSYTLLFAFATRAGAVFLLATATLGLRSGTFPHWFTWTGYLFGVVLLVAVAFLDWIVLLLPAWVAVVSLFVLRRERRRRPT
jgi:hypothetical protein